MILLSLLAFGFAGTLLAAEPKPFTLNELEPAKLPAAVRPGKGMPKEVIAVLGARGDKCDCFAFHEDGRFLAASGPDQFVRVWDLDGVKFVGSSKQLDSVVCLAFARGGKSLVVGDASGNVRIWDKVGERVPVARPAIAAHKEGPVWSLAISPDGKKLATGGRDKAIRIWDISNAKGKAASTSTLTEHTDSVRSLAFDADGKRLWSAGNMDETIRSWDMSGDKPKAGTSTKAGGRVTSLSLSSDGKLLASAGDVKSAKVWTLKDGVPGDPVPLETGGKPATSVAFAPMGGTLVGVIEQSPTEDRVRLWSADGKLIREFAYDTHIHAAGFAPDGRHLVIVSEFNMLLVRIPK